MKMQHKAIRNVIVMLAVSLLPVTAQAVSYTWSTSLTSGTWNTTTNWTPTAPTGGPSGANTATINNTTSTTVTLNTAIASLTSLTLGSTSNANNNNLTIATGGALKSSNIIMNGGTITGTGGTITTGTPISGYGTVTGFTGTTGLGTDTFTANNATYGNAMNISNVTANSITLGFSSKGTFNLSNVTVGASGNTGTALSFSGSTTYSQFTNPLPGTFGNNWGNVNYGLVNVTGDTTINGGISVNNYYTLNITNSTLTLNNPGTINGFNTSSPPIFVLGTGGNLNINGTIALGNSAPIPINGGSITHTTGTFSANSFIGNGSISGVTSIVGGGNVTASGGTLTFDAGTGVSLGSSSGSGANLSSSAGATLDLKGTYNYSNPGFIAPNGGTVQFDGATFNAGTYSPTLSAGTINVTNNSTMTGTFTSSANLTINSGKSLNASGATFTNNIDGTVTNNGGTANWGNFTNNGAYKSDPSTQTFNTLTVGSTGSIQATAGDIYQIQGNFTNNSLLNSSWNTSQAALAFTTGASHTFALAGADIGQLAAGFNNNFAWNSLDLTGQTLTLSDGNTSNTGTALYVSQLFGFDLFWRWQNGYQHYRQRLQYLL